MEKSWRNEERPRLLCLLLHPGCPLTGAVMDEMTALPNQNGDRLRLHNDNVYLKHLLVEYKPSPKN